MQIFFPDELAVKAHLVWPYSTTSNASVTTLATDMVYTGDTNTIADLQQVSSSLADGLRGSMQAIVEPTHVEHFMEGGFVRPLLPVLVLLVPCRAPDAWPAAAGPRGTPVALAAVAAVSAGVDAAERAGAVHCSVAGPAAPHGRGRQAGQAVQRSVAVLLPQGPT